MNHQSGREGRTSKYEPDIRILALEVLAASFVVGVGALLTRQTSEDNVSELIGFVCGFLLMAEILRQFVGTTRIRTLLFNWWTRRQFRRQQSKIHDHQISLERELQTLADRLGQPITEHLLQELTSDVTWVSRALERANLNPYLETVFGNRFRHFPEEKQQLAEDFAPMLFRRCRQHVLSGRSVILILDSGTTLYPFFKVLGEGARQAFERGEEWINRVRLYTNNLAGLQEVMISGRTNPSNPNARLALNCSVLPGNVLPVYNAVTGAATNAAVAALRREPPLDNAVFISLVTGNWVLLTGEASPCPVPLARGTGHLEFKQCVIECSDEIFVVAPLGKVLITEQLLLGDVLRIEPESLDSDNNAYQAAVVRGKERVMKLVTTTRESRRLLYPYSERVRGLLKTRRSSGLDLESVFESQAIEEVAHLLFLFDRLPRQRDLELETEFPHSHTRTPSFLEAFLVKQLSVASVKAKRG